MKTLLLSVTAFAALSAVVLGQGSQLPPDEIVKMIGSQGVYLDSSVGTPRFIPLRGMNMKVKVDKTVQPYTAWAEVTGEHAAVRTKEAQPVFYVYGENAERLGLVVMSARGKARGMQACTLTPLPNGQQKTELKRDFIAADVQVVAQNLVRITPKAPLAPGEYAFVPLPAIVQVAMMGSTNQRLFDFGIDSR